MPQALDLQYTDYPTPQFGADVICCLLSEVLGELDITQLMRCQQSSFQLLPSEFIIQSWGALYHYVWIVTILNPGSIDPDSNTMPDV